MRDADEYDLKDTWTRFRRRNPGVQTREAALALGVSEAELVAAACGESVTRLSGEWTAVLGDLPALGTVIAATRCAHVVLEQRGAYGAVEQIGGNVRVLTERFDLSCAVRRWHAGFAVREERRTSFQFFDREGTAVHKVFLDRDSDDHAYGRLVGDYTAVDQAPRQVVHAPRRSCRSLSDSALDREALCDVWRGLEGPDDFEQMLAVFRVTRLQALRAATPDLAYSVPRTSVSQLLVRIATDGTPVAIRVASSGAIQRHAGPVRRISAKPRWLTVRDPSFNLQLRTDRIASTWVVWTPSRVGARIALEAFNPRGETMLCLSSPAGPGTAAAERWDALVGRLGAPPAFPS